VHTIIIEVLMRVPDFHMLLREGGSSFCLLLACNRIRVEMDHVPCLAADVVDSFGALAVPVR